MCCLVLHLSLFQSVPSDLFAPLQLHATFLPFLGSCHKGLALPDFYFPPYNPTGLGLYGIALYARMIVRVFSFQLLTCVVQWWCLSCDSYVTKSLVHQVSNTGMKLVNTEWIVQSLIHGKPMTDYKRFSLN